MELLSQSLQVGAFHNWRNNLNAHAAKARGLLFLVQVLGRLNLFRKMHPRPLRSRLERKGEFALIQWALAEILAVVIANFAKKFF